LNAVALALLTVLASAAPEKKAKPPVAKACSAIIDDCVGILHEAITLLTTEARRRKASSPSAGHQALAKYLDSKRPQITELRARSKALQLEPLVLDRCEEAAYSALLKELARLSSLRSFYRGNPATFRLIGDLFL
jgi:hypothetical protein